MPQIADDLRLFVRLDRALRPFARSLDLTYTVILDILDEGVTMDTLERYYTVPEIAYMASVSRRTVVRWIEAGKLKAYRNVEGSPWRVLESEWDKFKMAGREDIERGQYTHALEMNP